MLVSKGCLRRKEGPTDTKSATAKPHHHEHSATSQVPTPTSLNRLAWSATVHCFTGCAIGEVMGMVVATAFGWGAMASVIIAVMLAFLVGYSFTLIPLVRSGMTLRAAVPLGAG